MAGWLAMYSYAGKCVQTSCCCCCCFLPLHAICKKSNSKMAKGNKKLNKITKSLLQSTLLWLHPKFNKSSQGMFLDWQFFKVFQLFQHFPNHSRFFNIPNSFWNFLNISSYSAFYNFLKLPMVLRVLIICEILKLK